MKKHQVVFGAISLIGLIVIGAAYAQQPPQATEENWPQWRGPHQSGVSDAENLPATWSGTENIVWKTPLPAWSGGTPIVWDNKIFLTSPAKGTEESATPPPEPRRVRRRGRRGGGGRSPGGDELLLICISRTDGEILWQRELDTGNQLHRKGNDSSPSPVTNGEHVWVVTGNGAVAAFDMEGNEIWKRNLQDDYGRFGLNWGYASSPLLYNGTLIIEVLHGFRTDDPSYIVAFNAATGEELWRQERPTDAFAESPDAYTTPALLEYDGVTQIVISGGDYVTGHQPDTGKEIWRSGGLNPSQEGNYRVVGSPFAVEGIIYAPTRKRPLLALRAGGTGDITDSHLLWKWDGPGAPDVPTPACDGTYFYMVDDRGLVTCLDAKTGEVVWGPERTAQGTVSSSPILADDKLYITNEYAVTTVIAAGPAFKILETNELDGSYTLSSPAASGSQLFMRTGTHLYCIGTE